MRDYFKEIIQYLDSLRLHPLMIIWGEIFIMGIVGGLIVFVFDPGDIRHIYYGNRYAWIGYLTIIYSSLALGAIGYGAGLSRKLTGYADRECAIPSRSLLLLMWWITFCFALACLIWIFSQVDMQHPLLAAIRERDILQVAVLRSEIANKIDLRTYNLGLIFFVPMNLIISVFLLRNILFSLLSFTLLVLLGTFTLAKAPIIYIFMFILIFRMLFAPLFLRNALRYLIIMLVFLVLLSLATRHTSLNAQSIIGNIASRILYGEVSDLPYYFEVFSIQKVNVKSLMPPYIIGGQKPAARIVAEYSIDKKFLALPGNNTDEKALYARVAGVANSFFTGEAFAWAGYPGVILSPFIVMAHLGFFVYLFGRIKKTWFTTYIFSFFLYKVFIGIFGGISYFIFSSMHIVLIAFLLLLISWRYWESKNIPIFNKIAAELRIL